MRVYISGPINTNLPDTTLESRKQMFYTVEDLLSAKHTPVNPLRITADCGGTCGASFEGHDWECWLKYDLRALLTCDAICLLPGWTMSRGAQLEFTVAQTLGYHPMFADTHGGIF